MNALWPAKGFSEFFPKKSCPTKSSTLERWRQRAEQVCSARINAQQAQLPIQ